LGALVCYSPVAALLTILLFLPIVATLYLGLRRKLNNLGDDENKAQRTKARLVSDSFRGYAEAEVFNAFPQIFNIFQDETNKIIDIRKRHATIGQLPQMFTEIGLAIGLTIIILISINNSSDNLAFLLGIFAIAALRLLPSLRSILTSWSMMRYHSYSIDTLSEATIDSHQQKHQTTERMEFNNEIELRNVGFSFDENNSPILKNISLTITKGERIGIRGVSGVGKTTLFYIILGLYKPSSGAIYIDGEKLDDSNIRKWQNNIGYVSQSVFIADLSLAENIALGYNKDEIDYDRMNRVIELANLNDFVDSLPNGIDSHIGEQGCRVSGGQRQRIGIARALYRECDILLLDEATSSLDNTTEQYINESIANLQKENESLTIIMIAHRESSLEYCNRIITLD
jgi:ABC-type multidrug transport system fused ATPase/permease subunit